MKLIALACSSRKIATVNEMPAIDRYNGPMWQSLRAALAECAVKPEVWVLSARYGFIPASTRIINYDNVLTERLAQKMTRECQYDPQIFARAADEAEACLFAGGRLYRSTMLGACRPQLPHITETSGGIGEQRAQMRAWIAEHCK